MRPLGTFVAFAFALGLATPAHAAAITFTKLTGALVGGSPAGTAVYVADLGSSGLGSILSMTLADNSSGLGGATGQFTGFDLDAIRISTTNCADTSCLAGATFLSVFDFAAGTFFTPGTQRTPTDPKLFGTGPGGTTVDNAVATLGAFDANSTTAIPGANGFLSMGDNGVLSFNLLFSLTTSGHYLYIGEVGDNGEVAAGRFTVSETPVDPVPEPASVLLFGTGLAAVRAAVRRRRQA